MVIGMEEMHNIFNYCHQKLENGSNYDAALQSKERLEFLIVMLFIWKTVLEIGLILIMTYE